MKLYIYEHCPFCVMTKMVFVLKNYPVEVAYLLYDDVQTPMQMVGRKLLPVLEYKPNVFMSESKDIIQFIDQNLGQPKVIIPEVDEITDWVKGVERFIYRLTYPRWIRAPFPEFGSEESRKYFHNNKDPSGRGFMSDLADPALLQRAQRAIDDLEDILFDYPLIDLERDLSMSDFSLFAQLHSLSIIKGLVYGPTVDRWRNKASETCFIPLNDEFAN
ncbi:MULTISPECIES: glutaredoxin 2 [Commensalibacter]|uniref:Glutaredoxin 2 n=2 Tax=Commensalibacter TaxID=1079922 RepID=W7DTU0_9PROT|nr:MULTISPECIES: glutaredoxin 2 [Commensalibacter]EUK18415.1 glutaredoxin 2 [Commensalibacter papalotli (ex Servin-Garciduenas et al. 2014)]CAI3934087.1 Glutaredoxin 2 (GrxB) (PDB:1G7O) [Commensalibacter papalotli (ex Botero et al. 2024)]CAI3941607.1 Glutaredoxin 2 (GrxB) (PDB:1G7O) [Commensalibacter papalotli (ex Botero et al. 2024)]